jgi:hypothetical protein
MAMRDHLGGGARREADPKLLRLDLSWAPDKHEILPLLVPQHALAATQLL